LSATRIIIDHPGGPEVLRQETYDPGAPGPGEALVRHEAIGLNFIDTHHRSGRYPLPSYPSPLGLEAAGIVEQIGPGVTTVAPGDRVAYATMRVGAYADRRVVPVDRLLPVPPGLDLRTAAAALNKGLTAHFLCHTTHAAQPGETILVHAAAGGVGSILCQWLRLKGATVIGTVGTAEKIAFAESAGCHHVLVLDTDDIVRRVREIAGAAMLPVVYDAVGPATFDLSLQCLGSAACSSRSALPPARCRRSISGRSTGAARSTSRARALPTTRKRRLEAAALARAD